MKSDVGGGRFPCCACRLSGHKELVSGAVDRAAQGFDGRVRRNPKGVGADGCVREHVRSRAEAGPATQLISKSNKDYTRKTLPCAHVESSKSEDQNVDEFPSSQT